MGVLFELIPLCDPVVFFVGYPYPVVKLELFQSVPNKRGVVKPIANVQSYPACLRRNVDMNPSCARGREICPTIDLTLNPSREIVCAMAQYVNILSRGCHWEKLMPPENHVAVIDGFEGRPYIYHRRVDYRSREKLFHKTGGLLRVIRSVDNVSVFLRIERTNMVLHVNNPIVLFVSERGIADDAVPAARVLDQNKNSLWR